MLSFQMKLKCIPLIINVLHRPQRSTASRSPALACALKVAASSFSAGCGDSPEGTLANWPRMGLLALSRGLPGLASAQDSTSAENSSAIGEAVPVENSAASLDPITSDSAALDSNGAMGNLTSLTASTEHPTKRKSPPKLRFDCPMDPAPNLRL